MRKRNIYLLNKLHAQKFLKLKAMTRILEIKDKNGRIIYSF